MQRWFCFATRVHGIYDKSWDRECPVSTRSGGSIPSSNNRRKTVHYCQRTLRCKLSDVFVCSWKSRDLCITVWTVLQWRVGQFLSSDNCPEEIIIAFARISFLSLIFCSFLCLCHVSVRALCFWTVCPLHSSIRSFIQTDIVITISPERIGQEIHSWICWTFYWIICPVVLTQYQSITGSQGNSEPTAVLCVLLSLYLLKHIGIDTCVNKVMLNFMFYSNIVNSLYQSILAIFRSTLRHVPLARVPNIHADRHTHMHRPCYMWHRWQ